MVRNDSDATPLTGNDRFYGFNVDVIRALSAMLNFRYELYVVDEDHSTRQTSTVSDRVVQELLQGVSISLGPFYGAIAVPSVTRCRCRRRCCCCGHRLAAARSGEWAQHFSNASCSINSVDM